MNLFIHVGAPRTGTSYLRKYVFPNVKDIKFYNKQFHYDQANIDDNESEVVNFFQRIAHYGDGDETASSLGFIPSPTFINLDGSLPKNVLISEEHFIWSVYHMMGNIGSRALILKNYFPNAKIILTIRRQPEYIISVYKYLSQYKNPHLKYQMRNILNFSNLYEEIANITNSSFNWIPIGINFYQKLSLSDIHENYFNRKLRHFITADMSWFRIYMIYSELFGKNNLLVLPQEMLLNNIDRYLELLDSYIGTDIHRDRVIERRENKSPNMKVFQNNSERRRFIEYVKSMCFEENAKLDEVLDEVDLKNYGYCDEGSSIVICQNIGFRGNREKPVKKTSIFEKYFRYRRVGFFNFVLFVLRKIIKKNIRIFARISRNLLIALYNNYYLIIDRLSKKNYSKIESIETLKLNPLQAKQYEKTKIFELKKWMKHLPNNITYRVIDFGSGKGAVLKFFSEIENVDFIYGIEISKKLIEISKRNLDKSQLKRIKLIHDNASNISSEIIDLCNLFYFYNPFPSNVFLKIIKKIEHSLQTYPREIFIVYFNPKSSHIIENSKYFILQSEINNPLSRASTKIYKSQANDNR